MKQNHSYSNILDSRSIRLKSKTTKLMLVKKLSGNLTKSDPRWDLTACSYFSFNLKK